ncbi:tRNase Z TRZ1-like isoform X2 [Pecten maximus]|uniref:tRNase Z TRZ1-like isoform X2 n=1 Tax=Pecten maximus TaxID=6579 RepID=UPI001458581C|nr:tRNase Z TRZ1-like isoform X2 [Pecten maximus]
MDTGDGGSSAGPVSSHGHMDHCSAIHQHASKRSLIGRPSAKYYLGSELVTPMKTIRENLNKISEFPFQADLTVAKPKDFIKLPGPYHVVPFKTIHRVPSMGFLVYKTNTHIKEEFSTCSNTVLKQLELRGEQVYYQTVTPELAYTGDTTFEVFSQPPIADLLKVKVLITECTYISTTKNVNEALTRERGHIHLHEIIRNPHIFADIEAVMLLHFSERYTAENIQDTIHTLCPVELKQKLYSACVYKEETCIVSY